MKILGSFLIAAMIALFFTACTSSKKVESPNYINENNVGITSHEADDQKDPDIIEGNLEDNDFKN